MKWKRSKKAQQEEKNGKKDGKDKADGDKMDDDGQVIRVIKLSDYQNDGRRQDGR